MTIFEAVANAGISLPWLSEMRSCLSDNIPKAPESTAWDLLDRQLIESPFYFIQPNDQIYAEPMKVREIGAGENCGQSFALVISAITRLALILNLLK